MQVGLKNYRATLTEGYIIWKTPVQVYEKIARLPDWQGTLIPVCMYRKGSN